MARRDERAFNKDRRFHLGYQNTASHFCLGAPSTRDRSGRLGAGGRRGHDKNADPLRLIMARYFSDTDIAGLQPPLVIRIDQMRAVAGIPIVLTCTVRTVDQNSALPTAVSDSAHLGGWAVDIRCPDSSTRFKLLQAAFAVGFRRIEVGTHHIHVDMDETKAQDVVWLGISS